MKRERTARVVASISSRGFGLKLVDAIALTPSTELRAYVSYANWAPRSIEIRFHDRKRERAFAARGKRFGFRPVFVPLNHVADFQQLLARAYQCALHPLTETPYAEA